jgi:hypothetical protein
MSYLNWEKFHHNIKFQLRKKRNYRDNIKDFLNSIIQEYQRLKEISPIIPQHIADIIKKKRSKLNDMILPSYIDGFHHITPYTKHDEVNEILISKPPTQMLLKKIKKINNGGTSPYSSSSQSPSPSDISGGGTELSDIDESPETSPDSNIDDEDFNIRKKSKKGSSKSKAKTTHTKNGKKNKNNQKDIQKNNKKKKNNKMKIISTHKSVGKDKKITVTPDNISSDNISVSDASLSEDSDNNINRSKYDSKYDSKSLQNKQKIEDKSDMMNMFQNFMQMQQTLQQPQIPNIRLNIPPPPPNDTIINIIPESITNNDNFNQKSDELINISDDVDV